ncbi:MAG: glycosyltransferase family 2 protein [Candidatus Omnitrophica bacterium]|nr:glycosyltransferase family 2 protein [Candidatus Omnitrophota bacterium]
MGDPVNACVVIPAFNVARTIGSLVVQLRAMGLAVVVVDDGSTDPTPAVATAAGADVLSHAANAGKGRSLRDGFAWGAARGHDLLVAMDGDGQHLPADLPRLVAALQADGVGVAVGNRMRQLRNMPWARRVTNWLMSWGISWLCRQRVPDSQCGFRAIRRAVLDRIPLTSERYEIESELLIQAARAGFRIVSVPITTIYRNERSRIRPLADTVRFFRFLRTLR